MGQFTRQIELIERLDQLIRFENTGNPKKLSDKLGISEAKLYRVINTMKDLNAPISYNFSKVSYVYEGCTRFKCGFYIQDLSSKEIKNINGGTSDFNRFLGLMNS